MYCTEQFLLNMFQGIPECVPRGRIDLEAADLAFGLGRCAARASGRLQNVLGRKRKDSTTAAVATQNQTANEKDEKRRAVEEFFEDDCSNDSAGGKSRALVALSVRTGFDLVLRASRFPRGSEVLMSAVTIRDMVKLVEFHGLVPVPVDVDQHTLLPSPEAVSRAVTPRTKVLVVAHVFGAVSPLGALGAVARRHGLLLVEDCAEALFRAAPRPGARNGVQGASVAASTSSSTTAAAVAQTTTSRAEAPGIVPVEPGRWFRGSANADVSMFSFGTIKTATALGGAVLRFSSRCLELCRGASSSLLRVWDCDDGPAVQKVKKAQAKPLTTSLRIRPMKTAVRQLEASYATQPSAEFAAKLARYSALHPIQRSHKVFGLATGALRAVGLDADGIITSLTRGFPGADLIRQLRRRPCSALVALLLRRLQRYPAARVAARASNGELLRRLVLDGSRDDNGGLELCVPGELSAVHTYWLFPILLLGGNPDVVRASFCKHMLSRGFDATTGATQLGCVESYSTSGTATAGRADAAEGLNLGSVLASRCPNALDMMSRVVYLVRFFRSPGTPLSIFNSRPSLSFVSVFPHFARDSRSTPRFQRPRCAAWRRRC